MSGVAEAAVIAKLKSVAGVTALVAQRVFPHIAPQETAKPYLIVMRPEGQSNDDSDCRGVCWCNVYREPIIISAGHHGTGPRQCDRLGDMEQH